MKCSHYEGVDLLLLRFVVVIVSLLLLTEFFNTHLAQFLEDFLRAQTLAADIWNGAEYTLDLE